MQRLNICWSNSMWARGIIRTFGAPPPRLGAVAERMSRNVCAQWSISLDAAPALRSPCLLPSPRVFTCSSGLQEGDICVPPWLLGLAGSKGLRTAQALEQRGVLGCAADLEPGPAPEVSCEDWPGASSCSAVSRQGLVGGAPSSPFLSLVLCCGQS